MRHKTRSLLFVPAMSVLLLAGCNSNLMPGTSSSASAAGTVPVSLSMTDDPPAGVSVLFFQVSLTAASLVPASGSSVSLLSNNTPIQIDVTQLQALSAFLSTANVTAGTYNSLSLTFANPDLVIFNQSDTSIASTCAVGSVCQLTPTIDDSSSTVSLSSSPFPVTVSTRSPLGLLIDFHLNTVIQSDLSVNLGVANGVTVSELPSAPTSPQFGFLTGTVGTVSASDQQFTLQTAWGRTFTIDTTSSTTFDDFPTSACMTAGLGCLAQGQVVQVQISSVASGGVLTASQVTYEQQATAVTVEGTIIKVVPPGSGSSGSQQVIDLILHNNPSNNPGFPLGGEAAVTVASNATYSIDANGFTLPSGLSFTGSSDLTTGQNVTVTEEPGTLSNQGGGAGSNGWGPPRSISFTGSAVELEPSQVTGMITATDSSTSSFTLGTGAGPFFAPWPMASQNAPSFGVMTTSQTTYTGFSPDSFDGLATGEFISVNGWLFPPASSGGSSTIAAQSVVMRPNLWF
jgi:Domain of unknown function (DUF4382)